MKFVTSLFRSRSQITRRKSRPAPQSVVETLESRAMLTASPLPVLLVIADSQDFYYQEYGDTRDSLEQEGVAVQVAATTLTPSLPHAGTGEPEGMNGAVVPDITLANVDAADYSAIVFVGGWGSSMYQYAFPGDYVNDHYDGDLATKQVVNNLINEFLDSDKFVAAICHGTTVLGWARRPDGTSPVNGIHISVPYIGSPAVVYEGFEYGNYGLGQYEQAVANGAIPNTASGQIGDIWTVADDVQVDGQFITAENYDSALLFGEVIAVQVKAAAAAETPPANQSPVAYDAVWQLMENSAAGTVVGVVSASDPDSGQTLTYAIIGGNTNNAFDIDAATGQVTIANAAAINFEAIPVFQLQIQVTDDAGNSLSDTALLTIDLQNEIETPISGVYRFADDLVVRGTSVSDVVYIWSGSQDSQVFVWMNDVFYGDYQMPSGGRVIVYSGDGNDQVFATDARYSVSLFGEGGHDLMTGGSADDLLDGGDGVDRLWAGNGNDLLLGGDGDDYLYAGEGNDVLIGNRGNDYLDGDLGRDLMIGGEGQDYLKGGSGEDLLIGGRTTFDTDHAALAMLQSIWTGAGPASARSSQIASPQSPVRLAWGETLFDDGQADVLWGGDDIDLVFAGIAEELYLRIDDLFVPA